MGAPGRIVNAFGYSGEESVCDLGCGHAQLSFIFPAYVGVDVSTTIIERNEMIGRGRYCRRSLDDLGPLLKQEEFDLAICCDVMEHIPEWKVPVVLREISKLSAKRFAFGISCRDSEYRDKDGGTLHPTVWEPDKWRRAVGVYFETIREEENVEDDFLMLEAIGKGNET
tara:strand:- start:17491 stop:17997 length:507 start_codon:yes stop_codon:yes gene_type:complete